MAGLSLAQAIRYGPLVEGPIRGLGPDFITKTRLPREELFRP